MPSEVIVVNWCDLCFQQDRKVEAVGTIPSPFNDKSLLVCIDHDQQVDEAMSSLRELFGFATNAKPIKRRKRVPAVEAPPKVPCKYKKCGHQSTTPSALKQHGRTKHGLSVQEMRDLGMEV